jgi:AraC-like DNA-binding protein
LRHALATLAQYRYLVNESLAIHIEQTGDLVILRESLEIETPRSLRQAHELAIGALCVLIRGFLGSRWLPVSVSFMHAAPKDMRIHRRLLGPAIAFNSDFNGIVCLAADMDKPNPGADPTLARYAKKLLANLPNMATESVVREVRKSIYLFLPLGGSSIARVAEGLGLTVRTLQRRLDSERVEFSDLVRSVRRDLAVRYLLNSSDPITKIADNLGYSQTSSFTRWFHTEFGSSPVKWRSDERLRRSRKRKRNVSKKPSVRRSAAAIRKS